MTYDTYEFKIAIKNQSNDSIFVDSSEFGYSYLIGGNELDEQTPGVINPKDRVRELTIVRDSLLTLKNPHSLSDMSAKELQTQGLVWGTIAAVLGQDAEDYEEQREDDESEWEEKHQYDLTKLDDELHYWGKKVLLMCWIPPHGEFRGGVSLPIRQGIDVLEIRIPMREDVLKFQFMSFD